MVSPRNMVGYLILCLSFGMDLESTTGSADAYSDSVTGNSHSSYYLYYLHFALALDPDFLL